MQTEDNDYKQQETYKIEASQVKDGGSVTKELENSSAWQDGGVTYVLQGALDLEEMEKAVTSMKSIG
ncbi:hypothetical protein [Brevibacillus massiliensis]|uniref:hypothetical protein n=1 Tax=Brevibacillus massiliensis TaxID=1118054 RepID=UPI001375F310|nr:hypothetical protein [Brevibacillus massiliensis]